MEDIPEETILVLPDEVEIETGDAITEAHHKVALSLSQFFALTKPQAEAELYGLLMRKAVVDGSITDTDLLHVAPVLKDRRWREGLAVKSGDVYEDKDDLWICITGHTTQIAWKPSLTPALWRKVEPKSGGPRVWTTSVDYVLGDVVHYPDADGLAYRCITAHTSQTGWEPPGSPALWEKVGRQ